MYRVAIAILWLVASTSVWAETPRARPPEFSAEDRAVFFDDAFTTLVGDRPVAAATGPAQASDKPAAADVAWADLVAPDVLETEIKRQVSRLTKAARSASAYKAGGYRDAADALGVIATLFAVTAEHAGEPRWRDTATGLRDRFAEAGQGADGSNEAAHQVATAAVGDLQDLVRGGRPSTPDPAESVDWAGLASRSTLMRRMSDAEEERLRGWVGSERAFRRNVEDVRHEAQVLAALAEATLRPEADDFDDPDYQAFARRLRDASARLAEAAEAEDQADAADAMTEVSRSCVDCHADYRG